MRTRKYCSALVQEKSDYKKALQFTGSTLEPDFGRWPDP
jgi:hypothetical protein